jgi:tetratricopeptide (TPR) repeat protein
MIDQKLFEISDVSPFVDKLFIGRENLLLRIEEAVADTPHCHIFRLLGEGGVGKTALLRKIYEQYKNDSSVIATQIDHVQAAYQTFPTLVNNWIPQLLEQGVDFKANLYEMVRNMYRNLMFMYQEGADDEEIAREEDLIHKRLLEAVNPYLKHKRLLILNDSVDVSPDIALGHRMNTAGRRLINTVIVLAGRSESAVVEEMYDNEVGPIYAEEGWKVHPIYTIENFDTETVKEYFAHFLPVMPSYELIESIEVLTEGKPVLLAFTVEWFKRHINLPEEIRLSHQVLTSLSQHELRLKRRYFERALIERARQLKEPLDKAILYLSFLDRRYDREILRLALGLSEEEKEEVEKLDCQLRQMAFIRSFTDHSSGLLHDEAKRLIHLHAWPPRDSDGVERRELAQKIIEGFYKLRIDQVNKKIIRFIKRPKYNSLDEQLEHLQLEQLAHDLRMECLDYHCRISLDDGRRYLTELIRESVSLRKKEGVFHEIRKHFGDFEANVAVARMDFARGRYEKNHEIIEQALAKEDADNEYRIALLYELSDAPTDPEEKAAYLRRAMQIAEESGDKAAVARITNDLGLMYRRQGLWAQAEEAYNQTLEILRTVDDMHQQASTLNNLAFVKLLRGEFDRAQSLADVALEMRESLGKQIGVAFSYLTKGEIAETMDNRAQASQAYRAAALLFEKLGRDRDHALAQIRLAEVRRHEQDFESAEDLLAPALALPLSEIRAQAERELGALRRTQGMVAEGLARKSQLYDEAVAGFQRSLETSCHKRDWYGQSKSLIQLIFVRYLMDGDIDESLVQQLKSIIVEHDYPVLEAELNEVCADVAYTEKKITEAFELYLEVARVLSTHNPRKYNAMFERFKRKFLEQPREVQQHLCSRFEQVIETLPRENRLRSSLKSLCWAITLAF